MHLYRFVAFVLFCFVAATPAQEKLILQDKFVFKIANEVFSLNEIKTNYQNMRALKCVYPESLSFLIFKADLDKKHFDQLGWSKKFEPTQINYFKQIVPFYKLLVYSWSYETKVNEALLKYFRLSAQRNNCDKAVFEGKDFSQSFTKLVAFEIFVRSRFLPAESQGKANKQDLKKAVISAKNLMASIDEQIDEEAYW